MPNLSRQPFELRPYNLALAIAHASGAWTLGGPLDIANNPGDFWVNGKRAVYAAVEIGWSDLFVTIDMWLQAESGEVNGQSTWLRLAEWHQHNAGRPANPYDEFNWARAVCGMLGVELESTLIDYLRPKAPVVQVPEPAAEKPPEPAESAASRNPPPPSS